MSVAAPGTGNVVNGSDGQNPLLGYFANKPAEELIQEMKKRSLNRWQTLQNRGIPTLWRLIYAQMFGMDANTRRNATQRLEFCGAQAEQIRFRVQMTRAHSKQRNQLAMGQRPSFRAVATNEDAASLAQVGILGKGITYVFRQAKGEQACYEALDIDGCFGEGFVWARWDADKGDSETINSQQPATDQFTGKPLFEADGATPVMKTVPKQVRMGLPSYRAICPWNVTSDLNIRDPNWREITEPTSKYELIARFPELAERLKSLSFNRAAEPGAVEMMIWDPGSATDDTLMVHHFYHRNSAEVPGGRYCGYVDNVVLWDVPCPVPDGLPIVSFCTARYFDTPIGYPEIGDLLSIQEMIDELLSQAATNILKFGNQNVWGEDGVEFDQEAFKAGGKFFTLKSGQKPPQVIQWATLPDAIKYLMEKLPQMMSTISGINATMLGEPPPGVQSGVFASLMQSIAEKFVGPSQAAYDFGINEVGNITLMLLRANAKAKFTVEVAGQNAVPYMQFLQTEDLAGVKRVYIERQSPLMNNLAGRFEVFQQTKDLPRDERHAAVLMLSTGDSQAWTEADESTTILIRRENEKLMRGIPCEVSKTDDHKLHATQHKASLDRLRTQDPPQNQAESQQWQLAQQTHVDHLSEHGITWMQTDPVYADMLGLPPPPMPPPNPAAPGGFIPHPQQAAAPPGAAPGPAAPGAPPRQPAAPMRQAVGGNSAAPGIAGPPKSPAVQQPPV